MRILCTVAFMYNGQCSHDLNKNRQRLWMFLSQIRSFLDQSLLLTLPDLQYNLSKQPESMIKADERDRM